MKHEQVNRILDDYLDGVLSARDAQRVEAHLEECQECRDEVAALSALLAEAAELPRSIEPARDLWPEIDARLDEEERVAGASGPSGRLWARSLWSLRYPLTAAAVLLIAVSSAVTTLVVRDRTAPVPTTASLLGEWRSTEEAYLRATAELLQAVEARRGTLDPEVAEQIDANLRIIDAAIQESRAALALDPTNRDLVDLLSARYAKKVEVLQQMTRLSAEL